MEERERDSALAESESGLIAQTETPKSVKYGRGVRKLKETGPTFESFKKTQPNLVRRIEKYNKAFDKLLSIAKEIEAEHEDLSDDALKRKIDEFNKRAERLGRLGVRVIAFDDEKKKIGLAGVGVKAINVPSRLTGLLASLNVAAYSEPYQAAEDAIIESAKSAIKDNDGKLTLKSYDILKGLKITPGDLIIRRESPIQTGEYDILEGIEFKPDDFKRSEFLSTVASGVNAERETQGLQPYEIVIPEEIKDDDIWSKEAEERVDASIKAILDRFKKASEETVETVEETQEEPQVLEEPVTVNYAEEFKTAVLNGGESLDSVLRSIHESGFGYTETSTGKKLLVYKGEMVPRSDIGKLITQSSPLIRVVAELEKSGAFESEEPLVISDEKLKASSYYRINHIRKAEGLDEIREVPVVVEREAVQEESPVSLTEMLDSVPGTTTEETKTLVEPVLVANVSPADQVYARVQEYLSGFENAQTEEEKQQILTGLQGYLTPKEEVKETVAETATQEQTQTDYAGFWNGRSR